MRNSSDHDNYADVAVQNLFAALGSDDEEDSRPIAKPSKPESPSEPKRSTDGAPARGGRGGAARGGRGGERRGGARGGRGRGGASRGGYSNDDGLSPFLEHSKLDG